MGPPHQLFRPSAERRVTLRDMGQRGARPVDQLFAQILVAALADSEQLRLTPGSELPRNQAQPCGEIATVVETFRSTNGGDKGRSDDRADPGCEFQFNPAGDSDLIPATVPILCRPAFRNEAGYLRRF